MVKEVRSLKNLRNKSMPAHLIRKYNQLSGKKLKFLRVYPTSMKEKVILAKFFTYDEVEREAKFKQLSKKGAIIIKRREGKLSALDDSHEQSNGVEAGKTN